MSISTESTSNGATSYLSTSSSDGELLQKKKDIADFGNDIFYSKRYSDNLYEYRHVILPKQLKKYYSGDRLLLEHEWRGLGIQQSPGWVHYMIHKPEPHILLFRRDISENENINK